MKSRLMIISFLMCMGFPPFCVFADAPPVLLNDSQLSLAVQRQIQRIEAPGIIPVGTVMAWPRDTANHLLNAWLPCNGQPVPAKFPELAAITSSVPNLNGAGVAAGNGKGLFLRGSTIVGATSSGNTRTDSLRTQTHVQPDHTHKIALYVQNPTISGIAAGQEYYEMSSSWQDKRTVVTSASSNPKLEEHLRNKEDWIWNYQKDVYLNGGFAMTLPGGLSSDPANRSAGRFHYGIEASIDFKNEKIDMDIETANTMSLQTREKHTNPGRLKTSEGTGLIDTTVTGIIYEAGDTPSRYTGSDETRPVSSDVIYMIKAKS